MKPPVLRGTPRNPHPLAHPHPPPPSVKCLCPHPEKALLQTLNWTRQSWICRSSAVFPFNVSFTATRGTALKKTAAIVMCAQLAPPTHSPHLSLSYSKLFDTFFLLYSLLGWYPLPQHPPHLLSLDLEDHLGVPPLTHRPNTSFFSDCTKEDGGITSYLLTKLVQKKNIILDWLSFPSFECFYFVSLFQFLGVYFSDFLFFKCFFYIVVYMKISFEHRKAIFSCCNVLQKLKLKASFDNYL